MKRAYGESHADSPAEKRSNEGDRYHPSLKFRLELIIGNLNEHMSENVNDRPTGVDGPTVVVGSAEWSLYTEVVKAGNDNGRDSLVVHLRCLSRGNGWRHMMDYTARVVGGAVQKVERGVKARGSRHLCVLSKKKEELLDPANGYLTDGTLKMEAVVTIYEPYRMLVDFFTADSNYNADVVLRVDERRFHVNKAHLGYESPVFYQMFFGPYVEHAREEIALEELDADEFLQFLGAVHRMRAPVTADNVENLVKLADRFQVAWLLGDCEDFLLSTNRFNVVQKLIISTKFNLDELQKRCLLEMRLEDVNTLLCMDTESAMGVKLDGRLLQGLLGKLKKLMESKHKTVVEALVEEHKTAVKALVEGHKSAISSLKAQACTRCRHKLS
ncbi:BTB/POZ domain-containing protein [Aphelenchoides avenae]|nr:BTB/POZ domain-containing protein [Aphelenchus avenae]